MLTLNLKTDIDQLVYEVLAHDFYDGYRSKKKDKYLECALPEWDRLTAADKECWIAGVKALVELKNV